jgi:head-tail adaptor
MTTIAAGELRRVLYFEERVEGAAQDATGAPVDTWEVRFRAHAGLEPLSGGELWNAQQIYPDSNVRITVRAQIIRQLRSGTKWRARYHTADGERVFEITNVLDVDERHQVGRITAIERPLQRAAS